jgi:O-antigen/teichoic acid export membrane protein
VTPSADGTPAAPHPPLLRSIARNVSTRYLAIIVEAAVGLLLLPFNLAHLGKTAYGLWMIAASITAYFSVLDLGYGGAMVKFVAEYRAKRDPKAINEILSTLFVVFAAAGLAAWLAAAFIAWHLDQWFGLAPDQAATGRTVLLLISAQVAVGFGFSVFGAVINGFQRYDLNNVVGTLSSLVAAAVNLIVLSLGFGLVTLVASTTVVRLATFLIYRANAYRVFPELQSRPTLFRRARLKEATGFSVFILLLDWSAKVNYSVDALVVGAIIGTTAVAVWTVAQRLAEAVQRLTNQLNEVLFPVVVDSDAGNRGDRLAQILVQGTRLSVATVLPAACALGLLADPLVTAWVGEGYEEAVQVTVLLAAAVAIRVGAATASTVLKGAGQHRLLAISNVLTAVANLGLSIVLARRWGLTGVAVGTLVPVATTSIFILFPAACQRVGLSVVDGWSRAVWPAIWPVLPMAAWLLAIRPFVPASLLAVALYAGSGALIHFALFVRWGLPAAERRMYFAHAAGLFGRLRRAEATT